MQEGSNFLHALKQANCHYHPWGDWSGKPWQIEFHNASNEHQELMAMAGNRTGKTASCGAKSLAYHMTGDYPDWWEGKRFDQPVLCWTGSPTNETSRDIVQKELLGGTDKETKGTGAIPRHLIYGNPKTKQAGISGCVDSFKVRHKSGGISECVLKTYEQGWRKWQGTAPHVVWMDEEPEDNEVQGRIYSEALTRLLTSHGIMLVTFTPLLGQTKLVQHFMSGGEGVYLCGATWEDAPHLDKKERTRLAGSYMDHEVEARTKGVPMMGEGAIFKVPERDVVIAPFKIPRHFHLLKGIDFGIDHPAGVADIAWDKDRDIIYITRTWRQKGADIPTHVDAINKVNSWVPVSWPHDGANKERSIDGNKPLKDLYKKAGARLLSRTARYANDKGGSQPQWPIIKEVLEREETGGIKVFSTCSEYLEERRNYHTKEGKIVSLRDDVLKSVFYAIMMRRFAQMNMIRRKTQIDNTVGMSTNL